MPEDGLRPGRARDTGYDSAGFVEAVTVDRAPAYPHAAPLPIYVTTGEIGIDLSTLAG